MALVVVLVFSTIAPSLASTRMPGIEQLVGDISAAPDTEIYSVLEIVPENGEGEIGYATSEGIGAYFDANMTKAMSEVPVTYTDFKSARQNAYEQFIAKLQLNRICALDTADAIEKEKYAIYRTNLNAYEEKYFKSDISVDEWHKFVLPEELIEVEAKTGSFEYVEGKGSYDRTSDTSGEQIVGFRLANTTEEGIYKVTFDNYTNVQTLYPGNLAYGGYTLTDINNTPSDLTDDIYVKTSLTHEDTTLNYISAVAEKAAGDDPAEYKYVPIYQYHYMENGDYAFTENIEADAPIHGVEIGEVFYKLNLESNEWMKNKVFGLEDTAEFNDFNIEITTLTPSELKASIDEDLAFLDGIDLLYICGSEDYNYEEVVDNDIDYNILKKIKTKITNKDMAVVIDSKILYDGNFMDSGEAGYNVLGVTSYICKLSVMALLDDIPVPDNEPNETVWSNDYATPFINRYKDYFTDGNFINKQVYCHNGYYTEASGRLLDSEFNDAYDNSVGYLYHTAFFDLIDFIFDENKIRDTEDQIPTDISVCSAIQYIISINTLDKSVYVEEPEKELELTIQSDEDVNSSPRGAVYFFSDEDATSGIPLNGSNDIYFNLNNPNFMATDCVFTVSYQYKGTDGTYIPLNASTVTYEAEEVVSEIESSTVYKVVLPDVTSLFDYLNENDEGGIRVSIDYTFTLYGVPVAPGTITKELLLTKMNLYNLE